VTLRSPDPYDHPNIDPAFAADPDDVRVLAEGVKQMRRIAAAPPLADIAQREMAPGEEDVEAWIRGNAHTIYHPVGTCSMGKVVDDQLRVQGVEGVRVIDASVIPNLMRGHPHPQVSMVALRGTGLIEQVAA
jgi:choline dehydrogenase